MVWWLILVIPAAAIAVVGEQFYTKRANQRLIANWSYARILPKAGHQMQPQQVVNLLNKLWQFRRPEFIAMRETQTVFRSIFHKTSSGEVEWYVAIPKDRMHGFKSAFRSAFPALDWNDMSRDTLAFLDNVFTGTSIKLGQKGDRTGLPLSTLKDGDPLPSILYSMGVGGEDEHDESVVDILISPISDTTLHRIVRKAEQAIHPKTPGGRFIGQSAILTDAARIGQEVAADFGLSKHRSNLNRQSASANQPKYSDLDPQDQNRVQAARRRYTGQEHGFKTWVRIGICAANNQDPESKHVQHIASARLQSIVSGFTEWSSYNFIIENRLLKGKRAADSIKTGVPPRGHEMFLTTPELACLWHLPDSRHPVSKHIKEVRAHAQTLKEDELVEGITIGTLKHPLLENRPVAIPHVEFTKHFFLSGITGSGKSSEATEICDSLIRQWIQSPKSPGFSYFDPAQETVVILLNRLLHYGLTEQQWDKVHFVSLRSSANPIGLNLLHKASDDESTDDLAEEAMSLLHYAYGGDTPQMDRLLRNGLRTLLEDTSQRHSIVGLIPLFTDDRFRKRVLPHVHDPVLKMFWTKEFPAIAQRIDQAMGPLLNRLNPFISNKKMRRMFGQRDFTLQLRKYMDEGHIFLWDLLGVKAEQMKLTMGLVLNQYHKTFQMRQVGSMNHAVIIDEAHEVQIPVMETIAVKDRKYGAVEGIITQFADQLSPWMVKVVRNSVQNIFTCTQGADAAANVMAMTNEHFTKKYLQDLPTRTVAVYTRINGVARSLEVEAPPPYMYLPDGRRVDKDNENEVYEATQWALQKGLELSKRDGRNSKEIDQELDQYLLTRPVLSGEESTEHPLY